MFPSRKPPVWLRLPGSMCGNQSLIFEPSPPAFAVWLILGGVAELRATRWCAERLSKKGPASGGRGFKVDGVRHLKAPVSPSPPIPQRCIRFQLGEAI